MSIDEEIAKQIADKIDIETVVARLDINRISKAVEKEILAAIHDYYWTDAVADVFSSDSVDKELRKTVIAVLKKMQTA